MFDEQHKKLTDLFELSTGGTRQSTMNQGNAIERHWDWGRERLGPDFSFPNLKVKDMWCHWISGNRDKNWPPFRTIKTYDLATNKVKKQLFQLRYLMGKLEAKARELAIALPSSMGFAEAASVYERNKDAVEIAKITPTKRARRSAGSWNSVKRELRGIETKRRKLRRFGATQRNTVRNAFAQSSRKNDAGADIVAGEELCGDGDDSSADGLVGSKASDVSSLE